MDTSKLAHETRRVWEFLAGQACLGGFTLIGGTALSMHLGHRISEDLDFTTTARKLPRAEIDGLIRLLEGADFHAIRDDDTAAYEEFLIAGMSLHDHQQNFAVNGVKVTFFTADRDLAGMLDPASLALPRVASLPELFRTKALSAANRSRSRDWIDLFLLFKQCGFTLDDFKAAFYREGVHDPAQRIAQAFQNLCRGLLSPADPGFEALKDPPPIAELAQFFSEMRREYETGEARLGFEQHMG